VPVPGASVVIAGLSVAGVPTDRFAFEGFVPARSVARRAFFAQVAGEARTIVCFEAGRRLAASLVDLAAVMPERAVVIGREVTKFYEDFVRGRAAALAAGAADLVARGEVTLFIAPAETAAPSMSEDDVRVEVARRRAAGEPLKAIARAVAKASGWSARDVYRLGIER